MACTFFGHHDCSNSIRQRLFEAIKNQIKQGTTQFYVGTHGNFDAMALSCLRSLKQEYPEIRYAAVLAYLPDDAGIFLPEETIFPEGIETIPKRYAIDYRNRWMIEHADTVVAYVARSYGGAAKYVARATNLEKRVINLADDEKIDEVALRVLREHRKAFEELAK